MEEPGEPDPTAPATPAGAPASRHLLITRRGLRLVHGLAIALVGALVLAATGGGSGGASADERWRLLEGTAALDAAPCPDPASLGPAPLDDEKLADARAGEFDVFGAERTALSVPIDWSTDPLGAHRYRQNLHKLRFLEPLLASYGAGGHLEDLRSALAIGADWVRRNPRGESTTPVEAWSDKVVGDRIPYISFLLRASACERLGGARRRAELLDSIAEHGRVMAAKRLYVADNHGLFVDLGLLRLVESFPFLPDAEAWRSLARERFEATLRGRLSEGVWLEHSSAYQLLAVRAVEAFLATLGEDAELEGLLEEMRVAASWFVRPDGRITQFGDSNLEPVPEWAAALTPQASGSRTFFDAGFGFVKAQGSAGHTGYLAVTDGFHNLTHKHADELSFELFDRGVPIVTDTGLFHKDPGEIRDYVVSNRAHSVLTADGADLPIDDASLTYGSGLTAAGSGDGWYAIEGRNRLLAEQGVRHRRLFLYRPGIALLIVDQVGSSAPHTLTRYLHFHPSIAIEEASATELALSAEGFAGAVFDLEGAVPATRTKAREQDGPLQGLTSPDFREFRPRWTAAWSEEAAEEIGVLSVALDETRLRAVGARATPHAVELELTEESGALTALTITRDGQELTVEPAP